MELLDNAWPALVSYFHEAEYFSSVEKILLKPSTILPFLMDILPLFTAFNQSHISI